MSLAQSEVLNGRRAKSVRRSEKTARKAQRVLALVDGTERANDVVEFLLTLANRSVVEVVLLNVQPEPEDWRLRGYGSFKRNEIRDRLMNDRGRPVVNAAGRKLEKAGITFRPEIRIGDPAAEAARLAKKERCDLIVTGEPKNSAFADWLSRAAGISFRSETSRVVQLADAPVVIVK